MKAETPARAALAGARHHQIEVARPGAGDELLDAVEHVSIPVAPGARGQRRGVGAGAGLGQAVTRDQIHAGEARQIAGFELRRSEPVDDPGDHVVDGEERRHGRATGRQRLEDQRRVEAGHAAAAMLVAHVNRRHAERRGLAQDSTGKCSVSSQRSAFGAMRSSAKAFAMSRTARWSAVSANTMPVLPGSFPADPIAHSARPGGSRQSGRDRGRLGRH